LWLAGLDAFGNVNSEGIYSFTRVLGMSPRLSILKMARNQLHDQDAIFLSECLSSMPGLQVLDLSGNNIGPNGMKALKLFIVGHCNLKDM
jgi:Ran GTPase-activating protein (RanGAP) involved in mRNA processing and transport